MNKSLHIGQLIEDEVRRQGLSITDFARAIRVTRSNAYDIFKRDNITLLRLKQISEALKHDFLSDLIKKFEIGSLEQQDPAS